MAVVHPGAFITKSGAKPAVSAVANAAALASHLDSAYRLLAALSIPANGLGEAVFEGDGGFPIQFTL